MIYERSFFILFTVVKTEADESSRGDPKEENVTAPPPPKSAFQKVVQDQRHPRASSPNENKPSASADAAKTSSSRRTGLGMATVLQEKSWFHTSF